MNIALIAAVVLMLTGLGYVLGRGGALASVSGNVGALHSLPSYHGLYLALWMGLPALALLVVWPIAAGELIPSMVASTLPSELRAQEQYALEILLSDIRSLARGDAVGREVDAVLRRAAEYHAGLERMSRVLLAVAVVALGAAAYLWRRRRIAPELRARNAVERAARVLLIVCSTIAVFITVGIVLSLVFEAVRFFALVPLGEFLFGLSWSPQTAIRDDQAGSSGAFGALPLVAGTLLITTIAMSIAAPIGLMSAIYMSEYASAGFRGIAKPLLEVLAGIPTVVYGFFAALTVAPFLRDSGGLVGLDVASESALAAGLVMGIMIIPFVSSLSDDVMNAVPQALRDGALALGATRSETIIQVVIPAALPGIVGAVLLAVSRAIGETMIVVMAAGLAANLTANPFAAVTTMTVQMVTLLVGDQEFDSAKTLAAFALGLLLFTITLGLNILALRIVQKYREKYD